MNLGDLFWVEFPPGAGRAQAGRRPAVIVQTQNTSQQIPTVLVVPLTTNLDALRFPGTLLVEPDPVNKLRARSVALVFQLTVIDQKYLDKQFGTVSELVMIDLWKAFDEITGRNLTSP
jgi:mRNA-degrading endonuclease toxin of MazEF toxin-antitoxin module